MNKVQLLGNVTRDIELKESAQNNKYAQFTLAVNRYAGGQTQTDFIDVVAFGRQAEILGEYGHKGLKLAVNGRLSSGQYVNKEGIKVNTLKVTLENFEFAGRPKTKEDVAATLE